MDGAHEEGGDEDAGGRASAAWLTPPHPIELTPMPPKAVDAIADHVARLSIADAPHDVAGPKAEADRFRDLW